MQWQYASEKRKIQDPLTGREMWQLTAGAARNVHLYFTENSFTAGRPEIYFLSDRETPGADNIFRMDLHSGAMERLTAFEHPDTLRALTKDRQSRRLLYWRGPEVVLMDTATRRETVLHTLEDGFTRGRLSLSCDGATVAIQCNEDVSVEHGLNYAGFAEKMVRVKRSRILTVPADASAKARVVFRDTAEGGHLQFSPVDPDLLMFCHEGPWHLVLQRIFLLDRRSGEVWPCFRQDVQDSVGHEFFAQNGDIFFDNRGPGHDGTITSDLTQAVAQEEAAGDFVPYVGYAGADGRVKATIPMPHYLNHYHADSTRMRLVGDGVREIALIDMTQEPPAMTTLCGHKTSWYGQHTHCHPTWAWDDSAILYASDETGSVQLYLVEMEP